MARVAMLGAGAFGTAVGAVLSRAGHDVVLLCRTAEQADAIRSTNQNARYFPGQHLPPGMRVSTAFADVADADALFLAFPARVMDDYAATIAQAHPQALVVNLVKGLHAEHFTFAELFRQVAPQVRYTALKGPTFARPLFLGEWSGLSCGGSPSCADAVIDLFHNAPIVFDRTDSADAIDIASALKNVYAIALGLVGSTGPSENTIYMAATLVIRELRTILLGLGYDEGVVTSFAGIGDTLLTGLCDTSRNRTLGLMIGKGIPLDTTRSDFLAEGVRAVAAIEAHLAGIHTPLLHTVADVLAARKPPTAIFETFGLR
ncbi:NAD(P)H-dependent glycerol-3-phosphate dehydrogenase [Sphingomonas sp.]|uniref:NAD(P)H-dependent glycerol-3-phosphate dehydrogenase n=1 Tax=Sphingomonas sp. TaxID=28214 RepID=UPI0035BBA48D